MTVEYTSDGSQFYALLNKKPPPLLSIKLAKPITIVDVLADYGTLLQMEKRYPDAEKPFGKRCFSASAARIKQGIMRLDCFRNLACSINCREGRRKLT